MDTLRIPSLAASPSLAVKCGAWPETRWPVVEGQALELDFFFDPSHLFVRLLFLGSPWLQVSTSYRLQPLVYTLQCLTDKRDNNNIA